MLPPFFYLLFRICFFLQPSSYTLFYPFVIMWHFVGPNIPDNRWKNSINSTLAWDRIVWYVIKILAFHHLHWCNWLVVIIKICVLTSRHPRSLWLIKYDIWKTGTLMCYTNLIFLIMLNVFKFRLINFWIPTHDWFTEMVHIRILLIIFTTMLRFVSHRSTRTRLIKRTCDKRILIIAYWFLVLFR